MSSRASARVDRDRGTLTVSMRKSLAHNGVMPGVGGFIARYSDGALIVKLGVPAEFIADFF